MDSLDILECLYMTYAEQDAKNREAYHSVFYEWIENIYKQLKGNQEEIIKGVSDLLQSRIEKQTKYSGKDICIICMQAGRMLQEVIDR